ncbi:MAG: 1-acyl-sn-glycerol-3-phosphate acyltransferase [Acidimicrobiia bacterium]
MNDSRRDRVLRKISAVIVWSTFRRVDVFHAGSATSNPGPLMSTCNHFGGFLDPLLTMYALPRRPRFIARDVIWRIPIARSLMRWMGAIPVHKADDKGAGNNVQMFGSCYEALGRGEHILIFPEGITRDEPSIGRFKTGTARIVLGAREAGVQGISLVPVGIHYEDKAALRSRVSVVVAEALDLDEEVARYIRGADGGASPDNREAVRGLTSVLDRRLREAAPDFESWRDAMALTEAAEITLRAISEPGQAVSLSERDRLAGVLAGCPTNDRSAIVASVTAYARGLDSQAVSDADMATSDGDTPRWGTLGRIALGLLLLPYAIAGFLLNLIPFLIVKAVGAFRMAPAAMASLKPIVAILVFGATWALAAWAVLQQFGWIWAAASLLVMPLYGIATVMLWERVVLGLRASRVSRARGIGGSARGVLRHDRRALVMLVVEST